MEDNKDLKKGNVEKDEVTEAKRGARKTSRVIMLRNRFFYIFYRNSLLVFFTALMMFFGSIGFLLFFANKPVSPQYIPVNEDGSFINLVPLNKCYDIENVRSFVLRALNALYKFDYYNYPDQINQGAYYFIQSGWSTYATELGRSKMLDAVKAQRWVVSVKPTSTPELLATGLTPEGICYWDVKVPAQLFFIGEKGQQNDVNFYFRVLRNSVINNPEGLGIFRVVQEDQKK